jgi:hypothetical protein
LGPIQTPLSLELAEFLLDHPDLSGFLVHELKIAPYVAKLKGPGQFWADDGEGSKGLVTLVDHQPGHRVYYVDGIHHSHYFPAIHAGAAVVMEMKPDTEGQCPSHIRSAFTIYVKLNNPVLSNLAKTIRPFIRKTVAHKFGKGFMVAHGIGLEMMKNSDRVVETAAKFPTFTAQDRAELEKLAARLKESPACPSNFR